MATKFGLGAEIKSPTGLFVGRVGAQLHSSPGDDSNDEFNLQNHSEKQRVRGADDTATVLASKPFNVLRPLADRHRVLLRVATATLHTTAAANADDRDLDDGEAAVETLRLVAGNQSLTLPSITDDDAVAVVEKSPSDDAGPSAATASDIGCPSPSPSPRRTCPSITVPIVHSSRMTTAEADDEVFRAAAAVPGATLTVDTCLVDGRPSGLSPWPSGPSPWTPGQCLVDGRPSLSSSADGQTDCTRVSGSDDSPLPDLRPSAPPLTPATAADADSQVRLSVPSPPILLQPRDHMPKLRSRRSARIGVNFQSLTAARTAPKTTVSSSKRSRRREKKVTKTLAIVLGKIPPLFTHPRR